MKIDDLEYLNIKFRFTHDNKDYIVYVLGGELSASRIIITDKEVILEQITDDKEWDMIETKIKEMM